MPEDGIGVRLAHPREQRLALLPHHQRLSLVAQQRLTLHKEEHPRRRTLRSCRQRPLILIRNFRGVQVLQRLALQQQQRLTLLAGKKKSKMIPWLAWDPEEELVLHLLLLLKTTRLT